MIDANKARLGIQPEASSYLLNRVALVKGSIGKEGITLGACLPNGK